MKMEIEGLDSVFWVGCALAAQRVGVLWRGERATYAERIHVADRTAP